MLEVNFDTICGPTHHFGGHSWGNIASTSNQSSLSSPKRAALDGLHKMKLLYELGAMQAVLPPQPRPDFLALRLCGFQGSDIEIARQCYKEAPRLLLECSSSSFMWTANSATITASCDAKDKKVHITPANLLSNFHRSIETNTTEEIFRKIFRDPCFCVHQPLPSTCEFLDEGAANQIRFTHNQKGLYLFVYGVSDEIKQRPKKYPARQTKASYDLLVRYHQLHASQVVFAKQQPEAIDSGVFHNDVIASGHELLFIYHEQAYFNQKKVIDDLQKKAKTLFKKKLTLIQIDTSMLTLPQAVSSYFFNSQVITVPGKRILVAPIECKKMKSAFCVINDLIQKKIIDQVYFVDLTESMKNGGGPACLRLRAPLTEKEVLKMHQPILFTPRLYEDLYDIIETYYPESLSLKQLIDQQFHRKCTLAMTKIMQVMQF